MVVASPSGTICRMEVMHTELTQMTDATTAPWDVTLSYLSPSAWLEDLITQLACELLVSSSRCLSS